MINMLINEFSKKPSKSNNFWYHMIVTETVIVLRFRIPVYQQIKNNIIHGKGGNSCPFS